MSERSGRCDTDEITLNTRSVGWTGRSKQARCLARGAEEDRPHVRVTRNDYERRDLFLFFFFFLFFFCYARVSLSCHALGARRWAADETRRGAQERGAILALRG